MCKKDICLCALMSMWHDQKKKKRLKDSLNVCVEDWCIDRKAEPDSVCTGEMTPRRIKDFVFVHFNAFKSLMDRDMGLRKEGWGTGEDWSEGPCECWSWRRRKKRKERENARVGVQERDEYQKTGRVQKGMKDEKQRLTSDLIQSDRGTRGERERARTETHQHGRVSKRTFEDCYLL